MHWKTSLGGRNKRHFWAERLSWAVAGVPSHMCPVEVIHPHRPCLLSLCSGGPVAAGTAWLCLCSTKQGALGWSQCAGQCTAVLWPPHGAVCPGTQIPMSFCSGIQPWLVVPRVRSCASPCSREKWWGGCWTGFSKASCLFQCWKGG